MPVFRPLGVFASLTKASSRLGFHTVQTSDSIPEQPGCYAWMLPLWIYRNDLQSCVRLISSMVDYEQASSVSADLPFKWETLALAATKEHRSQITAAKDATWNTLLEDPDGRQALQQILLEASLFLPPLYVGMTNNLKRRYLEHTNPSRTSGNSFRRRLEECVKALDVKLATDDLLFVTLTTPTASSYANGAVTGYDFNALVEQILMQICRPALSER